MVLYAPRRPRIPRSSQSLTHLALPPSSPGNSGPLVRRELPERRHHCILGGSLGLSLSLCFRIHLVHHQL
jgi:hypothetical protein